MSNGRVWGTREAVAGGGSRGGSGGLLHDRPGQVSRESARRVCGSREGADCALFALALGLRGWRVIAFGVGSQVSLPAVCLDEVEEAGSEFLMVTVR